MHRILHPFLCTSALTALLTSCSLFSVRVPGKSMSQEELNARVLTFDFADSFQATVATSADRIAAQSKDPPMQLAALEWKIEATAASRHAATRLAPIMALLDSWALAAQMREFFDEGAGATVFGKQQEVARSSSAQLEKDIIQIAGSVTTRSEFARYQTFISGYVRDSPLTSLEFRRASVVDRWWSQSGEHPRLISTVGTAPEVMSDFEERLRLYADDLPSETLWQTQLAIRGNDSATEEARRTLGQIDDSLMRISEVADQSPDLLRDSLTELRGNLLVAMDRLDRSRREAMQSVSAERAALAQIVEDERKSIANDVDVQRAAIVRDADHIANQAVETSWHNVHLLVRELVLYGLAAFIVGLTLPFAAGYFLGMARSRPRP